MDYRFHHVDVFTDRMFGGNFLAVFPDASGISGEQMQALANEMNLSETTFLLPPDDPADLARVRIFTPGRELPFAGHPTIGTAFVLATLGRAPSSGFSLQEEVGRIRIRLEGDIRSPDHVWMRQPLPRFEPPIASRSEVAQLLSLQASDLIDAPIRVGSAGVPFLFVPLRSREAVDRAHMRDRDLSSLGGGVHLQGVFLFSPIPGGMNAAVHSRMLGSEQLGIVEDPATGGASGPLGAYLVQEGLVPPAPRIRIVNHQGIAMGRPSTVLIDVEVHEGKPPQVEVGGQVVPVLEGTVHLA
jgi:trans-2,3-dihydro-3-hydroxyanthranilate isomerase